MSADRGEPGRGGDLGLKELVAMGVGGMVGGGIFSVLGLAAGEAGHAAPIAFALAGAVALLTGYSYMRLGLALRSNGGSFTYLEHAFRHPNIAGIGGWLLLAGYVGTCSLYAYTFGVYGTALIGGDAPAAVQRVLQSLILLVFMGVNLYGARASGSSEDVIVIVKVLILLVFAAAGLFYIQTDHLVPVFDHGASGVVLGAALIFVAYEGFELIPNAVSEMRDAERDLPRAIFISLAVTIVLYVLVSVVAVGNLTPQEIRDQKEYALAVAAKPFLGDAGFTLIALAALLSTSSAINATLFGTARLGMVMAKEHDLPRAFMLKEKSRDVPWASLVIITALAIAFVNTADLTLISAFSSATFLLIFAAINLSAWRLRDRIGAGSIAPLVGVAASLGSCAALLGNLCEEGNRKTLLWIGGGYAAVAAAELLFSERRLVRRRP